MMTNASKLLIKHNQVEFNDAYTYENSSTDSNNHTIPSDERIWVVSFEHWCNINATLQNRRFPLAILIQPETSIKALLSAKELFHNSNAIAFIAINFPTYTDGRGYSLAQSLRSLIQWEGELRAVGDVLIDTLFYLSKCGFDSFLLKKGHDPEAGLSALNTFTNSYQKSYK
jgi:uncharacterized protein (DUF934 family)